MLIVVDQVHDQKAQQGDIKNLLIFKLLLTNRPTHFIGAEMTLSTIFRDNALANERSTTNQESMHTPHPRHHT